ncbi:MAG: cob(I)yrinic acid a,c-diamide adenosyltransferase [Pseudomonadota bacterium]
MKIYTKTGDEGTTQVYSKEVFRLPKNDALLENYGNLDELNANVGMLQSQVIEHRDTLLQNIDLYWIQNTLFTIGFALSDDDKIAANITDTLESWIDLMTDKLPSQTSFILPGGCVAASQAHICRTVTRRTERSLVALSNQRDINPLALQFINRLSDFFFVMARYLNQISHCDDIKVG